MSARLNTSTRIIGFLEGKAEDNKVESLYRDFVILVGAGSGCDTILNLEFFPPKFELIYYFKEIFYISRPAET